MACPLLPECSQWVGWLVATAALRRKKAHENQLDQLSGQRLQLETQVNTIESANLNAETMQAMKKGSDALKAIHGNMSVLSIVILSLCNQR